MTKKTQRLSSFAKLPLAVAVAATMSTPASAFQFYIGDMEASLDTTLTAGASWRTEDPSKYLIGIGNGGRGGSINFDNGTQNFEKGDMYSSIVKGTSDFLVTYEDYGVFARAKYWYDFELKDNDLEFALSDNGKANASGAEFLDAYIWGDYWLGDDIPLSLRLGRQVVSWGESTFIINGINVINPLDIAAFRAPGAEVKEALLPVNMLYGSLGLTEDITVEAFVQLEYRQSRIEDCGTFFSSVDYVADGCGDEHPVLGQGDISEDANKLIPAVVSRDEDRLAKDTDQFGVALRWFAADWNETEFGFYYMNYHSRFPTVGGQPAQDLNNDGVITTAEAFDPTTGAKYVIEYPEDIQLFGISFNTTGPGGISLGGEYSFKKDMPIQLNSTDLILGAIGRVDPDTGRVISPVFQDRVPDLNTADGLGSTVADASASGFLTEFQSGYDTYDVSQAQMTAIKFIDQFAGASRLVLVGEVGATYVHDLPDADDLGIRYGRFDMAGFGLIEGDANKTGLEYCQDFSPIDEGCNTDGYVTDFSWGYRARAALQYNDVFAGVNLTPTFAWSHDVEGYAPGPGANFIEGRMTAGLSVKADYLNMYSATLGYTRYMGGENGLNPLKDRDNVALSLSYSF